MEGSSTGVGARSPEENVERLRLAVQGSNLGVWDWDLRTDCVQYDANWCELVGLDPATTPMVLDTWKSRVHPDDLEQCYRDIDAHLEGRTASYLNVHRIRHADGTWRHVLDRGRVSGRDDAGRPIRFTGTYTDISQTEEARRELLQAVEALHADVAAHARTEAVLAARLRLSEFARDHSLEEVLTQTLDEAEALTGSTIGFFHFVDGTERNLALQTWSTNTLKKMCTAAGKGAHYPVEQAGVWADALRQRAPVVHNDYAQLPQRKGLPAGHAPVSRELVVPILRNGRVVGLLGVGNAPAPYASHHVDDVAQLANLAWDIVLAKRTEEDLRRREALLAQTQAFSGVGGWEYDVRTKTFTWTDEVRALCEVGPDVAPGPLLQPYFSGSELERARQAFERASRDGEPFELEAQLTGARGVRRWVRLVGRAERADGQVVRVLGLIMDVTQRRSLEARLALDDRLATMGMLAAGIGHELNNPLAYVLANVHTLAEALPRVFGAARECASSLRRELGGAALPPGAEEVLHGPFLDELLECATSALEGTRRIQRVSQRMATFARADAREPQPVDLNAALETAVVMVQSDVRLRAALVKDLGPLPKVAASEGKLSQLFVNLLTNAARAVDECGAARRHTISLRSWAVGGDVFAEVSDTGCGMAPEQLERVYEPFFSSWKGSLGSGLGLPVSRNIVVGYGGELRVASEVGKGTRVLVRLPAHVAPVQVAPAPASAPLRSRVLVIDDEAALRRSLARLLNREHEVVTAASGAEALALLETDRRFDAVLCDLMMPTPDGTQVYEWVARHDPALAARFVFITGGAFTPEAAAFLAHVEAARVDKPWNGPELRQLVAETARRPRALP